MQTTGYLSLVLHGHLPFVRHPEYEQFFEERWFFEALTECYIPLLRMFNRVHQEGIPFRVTFSLSPTLLAMFEDSLLRERYLLHLDSQIELAEKEVQRTRHDPQAHPLAQFYRTLHYETRKFYLHDCDGGHPETAFRQLAEQGCLELITSAATHGFLPLLQPVNTAVRAQILTGTNAFKRTMGYAPAGIWLPECGYFPDLEKVLKEAGIQYFFLDAHGIQEASVTPPFGVMAPVACPNGVMAFGRDPESSEQVWSGTMGYPGDFDYREYYRDIGYDLPLEYIGPYILDGTQRINTGFKYHRITNCEPCEKELYNPQKAREKTRLHARHFLDMKEAQVRRDARWMIRPPCITAPFDAELFGHWWFEGPIFIEHLIREAARRETIQLTTPSDYLAAPQRPFITQPSASTWGHKGYNEFWLSDVNEHLYPQLLHAALGMQQLANDCQRRKNTSPLMKRTLQQAARNILLAQASDWPFIMKTGTNISYAQKRVHDHLARFYCLEEMIQKNSIDEPTLAALEHLDKIFPDVNISFFAEA